MLLLDKKSKQSNNIGVGSIPTKEEVKCQIVEQKKKQIN